MIWKNKGIISWEVLEEIIGSILSSDFFIFLFFTPFLKKLSQINTTSHTLISFKFGTPIRHIVSYPTLKFGVFKPKILSELWAIISLKTFKIMSTGYTTVSVALKFFPETILLLKVDQFEGPLN